MADKNLQKPITPPPLPEVPKSKIIGTEWFMVILALVGLDIIQIIFTALAVPSAGLTELLNFFIDLFIGPTLILYFYFRGVKLDWKVMVGICIAWFGETVPLVEALPLWSLDAGYVWFLEKSKEGGIFGMGSTLVTAVVAKKVAPKQIPSTKSGQQVSGNKPTSGQNQKNIASAKSQGLNTPPPIPTHEYNPLEQKPVVARDVKQIKPAPQKEQGSEPTKFKSKSRIDELGLQVDYSNSQNSFISKNINTQMDKKLAPSEKFVGQNRRAREELDEDGEYRGSRVG